MRANKLNAAVLSLLLLFGQAVVVVHSIDHPYLNDKGCVLCQFGQQEKSAVSVQFHIPPPCKQEFVASPFVLPVFDSIRLDFYQSRAPPVFS